MNNQLNPSQFTPWSDNLIKQTRNAISQLQLAPDGKLYFKHKLLGYAFAELESFLSLNIYLKDKSSQQVYMFEDIDSLLSSGWVID